MIKSYNRKGFGFIMCKAIETDIYFSRESLHPLLQTSDLAGENVVFEVHRFSDGKLQARNLRPTGDVSDFIGSNMSYAQSSTGKGGKLYQYSPRTGGEEEDRSRDWYCQSCHERNFVKRFECFKCKSIRPRDDGTDTFVPPIAAPAMGMGMPVKRTLSPHAGSRAMREVYKDRLAAKKSPSRSPASSSRSSSSESSRERKKRKKDKKKSKKKKRSKSKSSGSEISSDSDVQEGEKKSTARETAAPPKEAEVSNPAVEAAKVEALGKLTELRKMTDREARIKEWRNMLRQWHPDKNPDRVEVATAVFQFLQKGKTLIDTV